MVKLIFLLLFFSISTHARDGSGNVTAQDVRSMIEKYKFENDARDRRLKGNPVDYIKNERSEGHLGREIENQDNIKNPQINVENAKTEKKGVQQLKNGETGAKPRVGQSRVLHRNRTAQDENNNSPHRAVSYNKKLDPNHYNVPNISLGTDAGNVNTDYERRDQNYYGISIGTWVRSRINRSVTSADNSPIEIELLDDVIGLRETLPSGTIVFGYSSFNQGTKRMDALISNGIKPNKKEFSLNASLYDIRRVSGVSGTVIVNRDKDIKDAATDASFTVIDGALQGALKGNVVAEGLSSGSKTLMERTKPDTSRKQVVVKVSAQDVYIRIDKTF